MPCDRRRQARPAGKEGAVSNCARPLHHRQGDRRPRARPHPQARRQLHRAPGLSRRLQRRRRRHLSVDYSRKPSTAPQVQARLRHIYNTVGGGTSPSTTAASRRLCPKSKLGFATSTHPRRPPPRSSSRTTPCSPPTPCSSTPAPPSCVMVDNEAIYGICRRSLDIEHSWWTTRSSPP